MAVASDSPAAMKPPLYRPPVALQRSKSSQESNGAAINGSAAAPAALQEAQVLFHRSASLDTPGVLSSHPKSPEVQEFYSSSTRSSTADSSSNDVFSSGDSSQASSNSDSFTSSVKPPEPPPLPPSSFLPTREQYSSSSKRVAGVLVPEQTVETWDQMFVQGLNADVCLFTEDGGMTAAHSFVLAASSPVLRSLLEKQKPRRHRRRVIHLPGVPYDAGRVFTRFLYSSRYEAEEMKSYVLHLLVLSHVYSIPLLKRTCTQELERGLLNTENAVDVLKLARLCDAPRLNLLCLRLIVDDFKAVVKSDGWRVMRDCDQTLEQELVGHVIDADARKQERRRKREEDRVYKQLHDAMEALVHICRDGCRTIGPQERSSSEMQRSSSSSSPGSGCGYSACKGLESLVRHFASCRVKVSGGCLHCKRMWQLLELHSRMCGEQVSCKVPLCRHFKDRIGQQTKKEEARWNLLVSKVAAAKGGSTGFSLAAVSETLDQEIR